MSLKSPSRVYTVTTTDGQPSGRAVDSEIRAQRVRQECRGAVAGEHLLPILLQGAVDTLCHVEKVAFPIPIHHHITKFEPSAYVWRPAATMLDWAF